MSRASRGMEPGPSAWRAPGAMVGATLLWGATFVVARDSLRTLSPVALVCARSLMAGPLLVLLAVARRRPLTRGVLLGGWLGGLCCAGGFLFQAIGLTSTSAGSSAFLTCAGTLLAALYAWPLLGQRPSRVLLQGLLLALLGSALLSVGPVAAAGLRFGVGEVWTLAGAAIFGLQIVVLGRFAPEEDGVALAAVQAMTVALVLLPFAAGRPLARFATLGAADVARVAYLLVAGTIVAPLLQILAQRELPAGRVALLFALEPVFALLFALGFGGESYAPRWWLGAALILIGVIRVEWRAARPASA